MIAIHIQFGLMRDFWNAFNKPYFLMFDLYTASFKVIFALYKVQSIKSAYMLIQLFTIDLMILF